MPGTRSVRIRRLRSSSTASPSSSGSVISTPSSGCADRVRPLRDRDAKAVYTLDVRADVTVDAWSVIIYDATGPYSEERAWRG